MRLKIIAGNIIVLLIVGLGSYLYLKGELEEGFGSQFEREVATDTQLFRRSWRLSAVEFVEQVATQAARPDVRGALRGIDENSRRRAAHERSNSIAAWFQDPSRGRVGRPDVVLFADETGRVVARDQDPNRMSGRLLMQSIPALRGVINEGIAAHDAWFREDENKLLQVAMAPIRNDEGGVLGALVVGYDISNGVAERESDGLGREVAFIHGGNVYSSSLSQNTVPALQAAVGNEAIAASLGSADGSALFMLELGGENYAGMGAALPATPSQEVSFVILGNRSVQLAPIASLNMLLILVGLGGVLILVYGFLIGTSFLRPVEQMEEAILNIINGRTDTRIDIEGGEFGGLAYRINQLINMLMGVEETDEEGHSAGAAVWEGAAAEDSAPAESGDDDAAAELASEPEASYQQRVYDEYVAAKKAVGEDVSNIPKDRFISRLDKNAANLVKKHGCRMVRFQVQTKGSQVILRPVIIR